MANRFWMKFYEEGKVLAVCDEELLGNVYEEGKRVLDLKSYSNFYKGKITEEPEVKREMKNAKSLNLVGKNTISCAKEMNLVGGDDSIIIGGVPHVQIYFLK